MNSETKGLAEKLIERNLPIMSALDIGNIDTDSLTATPIGKDGNVDGKVYFKFKKEGLSDAQKKEITRQIMDDYFDDSNVLDGDEYYIKYDPHNKAGEGTHAKEVGGITDFVVKRNGRMYCETRDIIGNTLLYMMCLDDLQQFGKIKNRVEKFADKCYEIILGKLRGFVDVDGTFVADKILGDIYIHREENGGKTSDYVVYNWQKALNEERKIEWVSFMNDDRTFIALN